jgi:hypothetical protein
MRSAYTHLAAAIIISVAGTQALAEPLTASDPLFQEILKHDQAFFGASNGCDIEKFASFIDEEFEFYHDRTGLTVGKAPLVEVTRKNLCKKVRRELKKATFAVYPLEKFGAISTGSHTFCNLVETPVCEDRTNGTGRFFMLWKRQGAAYKLTRVISYDHVDSGPRAPAR